MLAAMEVVIVLVKSVAGQDLEVSVVHVARVVVTAEVTADL